MLIVSTTLLKRRKGNSRLTNRSPEKCTCQLQESLHGTAEAKATGWICGTESDIHRVMVRVSYTSTHRLAGQNTSNRYYLPQTPERKDKTMHHLKAQQCRNGRLVNWLLAPFVSCSIAVQHLYTINVPIVSIFPSPKVSSPPSCPREKH